MKYLILIAIFGVVICDKGFGRGGRGGGGGFDRHRHPFEPPFLQGLNKTVKREFFSIFRQPNETIAQQKDEVMAWAEKYNLTEQVQQFEANMTAHRAELAKNVSDLIAALPTIQTQLENIYKNETQTRNQIHEAIEELKRSNRKEVDVLFFIAATFKHRPKGGPRGKVPPFNGPSPFGRPQPSGPGFGGPRQNAQPLNGQQQNGRYGQQWGNDLDSDF